MDSFHILMNKFAEDLANKRFYERFFLGIAKRYHIPESDIPDLIQDFYIHASEKINQFRGEFDESTDILERRFTICMYVWFCNFAKDYHNLKRKEKNRRKNMEILIEGSLSLMDLMSQSEYLKQQKRKREIDYADRAINLVHDEIGKDETVRRQALFKFGIGKKYKEIAEEMHKPLGTIKSSINAERQRLKKLFKDNLKSLLD